MTEDRRFFEGMGDEASRMTEEYNSQYDILDTGRPTAPQRDIVAPCYKAPKIPGMEGLQKILDDHFFPYLAEALRCASDFNCQKIKFVKNENWIVPPPTAIAIDEQTVQGGVTISATEVTLISFQIPDRMVAVIHSLGQQTTLTGDFDLIIWKLYVNDQPVPTYGEMTSQLGRFVDPTKLGAPIILKGKDTVRMTARLGTVNPANFYFARIMGYKYIARDVTDNGSFNKFRTL